MNPAETGEAVEAKAVACRKLRIFPTAQQRQVLFLWLDTARYVYNKAAEAVNATHERSLAYLRATTQIPNDVWRASAPERMHDVPYEIRDSAVQDVAKACVSTIAAEKRREAIEQWGAARALEQGMVLKSKEPKPPWTLKFRRKKDLRWSVGLGKRQLNRKSATKSTHSSVWASLFGTIKDRSAMATEQGCELPRVFRGDCRLLYERGTQAFYLCMPITSPRPTAASDGAQSVTWPDTQGRRGRTAILAPSRSIVLYRSIPVSARLRNATTRKAELSSSGAASPTFLRGWHAKPTVLKRRPNNTRPVAHGAYAASLHVFAHASGTS